MAFPSPFPKAMLSENCRLFQNHLLAMPFPKHLSLCILGIIFPVSLKWPCLFQNICLFQAEYFPIFRKCLLALQLFQVVQLFQAVQRGVQEMWGTLSTSSAHSLSLTNSSLSRATRANISLPSMSLKLEGP